MVCVLFCFLHYQVIASGKLIFMSRLMSCTEAPMMPKFGTWRILALFSGDRRHGDPQKVSGDGGEDGKLNNGRPNWRKWGREITKMNNRKTNSSGIWSILVKFYHLKGLPKGQVFSLHVRRGHSLAFGSSVQMCTGIALKNRTTFIRSNIIVSNTPFICIL